MEKQSAKTEDTSQKNNDKYASILYYRLRNKIVLLRRFAKNCDLMGYKDRLLEAIKTTEMQFDTVGKEYMHIMRTGNWSKFLIQKMEFINMGLQSFAMNIIESVEERRAAKKWNARKPKPDRPSFKTTGEGLKSLADKAYSLISTKIPDEIRNQFSTQQIHAVNNLNKLNQKILEEIEVIKDKFDDCHKFSRLLPLMMKQMADHRLELPTEFVVLRPWSINECELSEGNPEDLHLFKKLTNISKKILSELKQINFNHDLFTDNVPDQVSYSNVKEILHLPIPKDCSNSEPNDISYPTRREGYSDNPLIRIIDAHKELLYKIRCVRQSQFRLDKVKHNICYKDDYLALARDKYYDPYQEDEIKYFSYETWEDEPVTPAQEEKRYNEHFEYYKDCKNRDYEQRVINAQRRKSRKLMAVERNKFVAQCCEEARKEARQRKLEESAKNKLKNIKQGKYKLVNAFSSSKLSGLKIYKEISADAKVAGAASAGDTTILENDKKENIIKEYTYSDENNQINNNIIDINNSKKEGLNKKKPHY